MQKNAQNPLIELFDKLNRSREETTSSFFLKKNIQYGKILQNLTYPTHPNSIDKSADTTDPLSIFLILNKKNVVYLTTQRFFYLSIKY
jgi:hypothetical protein